MTDLNDLFYFVKVVQHGGFAAASREINIPKSKLSRRIALLEERLGVRLIQRSTRKFDVTELGQEYYRHCQAMMVEAEAAQEVIDRTHAEPRGLIRVSCPPAWLYFHIADMIARFMNLYPRIHVHLEVTNKNVDLLQDGIDVAFRVRFPPLEDTDLVMKVFAINTQRLVGHRDLVRQYGMPESLADLDRYPTIGLGNAEQQNMWVMDHRDGQHVERVKHTPRLIVNDMVGIHASVHRGVGIATLPLMMIHQELASGELIDLTPDWQPRSGIVHAVYPSRRGLLPSVRALLDFLSKEFEMLIDIEKGFEY